MDKQCSLFSAKTKLFVNEAYSFNKNSWYHLTDPYSNSAYGVTIIIIGNGYGDPSSNPGWSCISDSTYMLGKATHPTILWPVMARSSFLIFI